jgi:hypothetical protein
MTKPWYGLFRGLQLKDIDDLIAIEMTQQRISSAEVVSILSDEMLAHPSAVDVARAATLASYTAVMPARNDDKDLDRARERRGTRCGHRW